MAPLTGAEVAKHNSASSCWVIISGHAYDVTEFMPDHPGGQAVILKYAGRDATSIYEPLHPPDTLDKHLDPSKHLGAVDMDTVAAAAPLSAQEKEAEDALQGRIENKPLLEQCYNLMDFEAVARRVMRPTAWGYYSSAADDEITMRENKAAFGRVWFRPRILVDVSTVDISTTLLGAKSSTPFYITATALARLGHPEGEVLLAKAAERAGVVQMVPTLASCALDDILDARGPGMTQWLQLYVNKDRSATAEIVKHAEERGCRGLFVTVDAPQLGRREKDMRTKNFEASTEGSSEQNKKSGGKVDGSQGAARAISGFIDPSLSWRDIKWLRGITRMPIVLKGVQRWEDAVRAAEEGVEGVVLSNHGGRQLDFARSGLEVLAETMPKLRERGLDKKMEVFIDGGIRRGTDIIKALCLGAKGVGIGRPFLYAMSAYGPEGVDRAMALLKDEMEMNMRLIGARNISELGPDLVDVKSLEAHGNGVPEDHLGSAVYDPLVNPSQKVPKSKL